MLDPSPRNELGKNILDPAQEQALLAQGYTYARRVYHPDGHYHLSLAKTDISAIATQLCISAHLLNNTTLVCETAQNR